MGRFNVSRRSLLCVLGLLAAGCSAFEYVPMCEQATREFHASMNAQEYERLFAGADDAFRSAQPESEFTRFAESNLERFGTFVDGSLTYKHVNVGTGGTVVSLQYSSEFEKGWAREELRWRILDGVPKLLEYSIAPSNPPQNGSPAG